MILSSLFLPRQGERFADEPAELVAEKGKDLPAWPLYTLLYGYPVIWALGLGQFAPTMLAVVMFFYMIVRGHIMIFTTHWVWFALVLWCLLCTVSLNGGTDILAWGLRWVNIFDVGIYSVYFFNARRTIPLRSILGGLVGLWATVVVLGYLALLFPDFRLNTPMGMIMPEGLKRNELVRDYVMPPLAEVQRPWGAPEPYIRPSAPFPYANSWGLAFTFLTPVVIATLMLAEKKRTKVILSIALCLGLIPAIATSNRGMFLGLGISVVYVIFRYILRGNLKVAFYSCLAAIIAIFGLIVSGAFAQILGRQEYSDSTGGRAALYAETWDAVLQSPLVGYGTPRMSVSVGVSMGTQGYFWTLLFCFGIVGLGFFVVFMLASIINTWNMKSAAGLWIHAVPISAICVFVFYSFDIMQLTAMMLCFTMCMRSIVYEEGL